MQTTVQRNSRSLDMSRVTWKGRLDLIGLRKPHTAIFSELWNSILHVVDMPFEWTDNPNFFFFTVQFYQTCRIPDETKKILGPKISPPKIQALISPSPEIFPWRINVRISKCLWLVYLSYHPLNFTFFRLTDWTARPALYARVRYYTRSS